MKKNDESRLLASVVVCVMVLVFAACKTTASAPTNDVEAMTVKSIDISEPVTSTVQTTTEKQYPLTEEEIELIALVTMAEAEGEPELGKRLVIDTILNRVDHDEFSDTVHDVIYYPNAFEAMHNGRVDRCEVREDICELVREELESRTNYDVIFFRTEHYSKYGTPMFPVGDHYFSEY